MQGRFFTFFHFVLLINVLISTPHYNLQATPSFSRLHEQLFPQDEQFLGQMTDQPIDFLNMIREQMVYDWFRQKIFTVSNVAPLLANPCDQPKTETLSFFSYALPKTLDNLKTFHILPLVHFLSHETHFLNVLPKKDQLILVEVFKSLAWRSYTYTFTQERSPRRADIAGLKIAGLLPSASSYALQNTFN